MHQVTVDIEQRVAIRPVHHDVALPDLLEHGPRGGHHLGPLLLSGGFEFVAERGAPLIQVRATPAHNFIRGSRRAVAV